MSFSYWRIIVILILSVDTDSVAQQRTPFRWEFSMEEIGSTTVRVNLTVILEEGWHIYSQYMEAGGPLPTVVTFKENEAIEWTGSVREEGSKTTGYDSTFLMEVSRYSGRATFYREGIMKSKTSQIEGTVEFMICNDQLCRPPEKIAFLLSRTAKQ